MYATGTSTSTGSSNSATGYGSGSPAGYGGAGSLGAMRTGVTPEQMGLQKVDVGSYLPKKAKTMYDPGACRKDITKQIYRLPQETQQGRSPIRTPMGFYPNDFRDFMVGGIDMKSAGSFKSEFKPSYS
jgi:hypothetical protein